MSTTPPSIRQQWILIVILMAVIVLGAMGGYWLIQPAEPPVVRPVVQFTAEDDAHLRDLLDAGQYEETVAETDRLAEQVGPDAAILRHRTLALLMADQPGEAIRTADEALALGAGGSQGALLHAAKALAILRDGGQPAGLAKEPAERAVVQAGHDPQAGLMANIALAAALRREMVTMVASAASVGATSRGSDRPSPSQDRSASQPSGRVYREQAGRIRRVLEPIYAVNPVPPKEAWLAHLWRYGLAMYGESGLVAGAAGDRFVEAQVLTILPRCCPADVWQCDLKIPSRAIQAIQRVQPMGTTDDHARAALCTAVAVLYDFADEPRYADGVYDMAMSAWRRIMDTTEQWGGEWVRLAAGDGAPVVGAEYFAYRHCLERIAVRRADQWSQWIAGGQETIAAALAACDQPLFVSLVRLRTDRSAEPLAILTESKVEVPYWPVLANLLEHRPGGADLQWARSRAEAVRAAWRSVSATQTGIAAAGQRDRSAGGPPVPEFGWSTPASQPVHPEAAVAESPAGADWMGREPVDPPTSQPVDDAQARAAALSREIHFQLEAGNLDKALDAYFQLQGAVAGDAQTSPMTRSLMEMFSQSIEGMQEVQDLLDELEGKPKTPRQPPTQRPRR